MHKIHFVFSEEKDAHKLNHKVRNFFNGLHPFDNLEITPVNSEISNSNEVGSSEDKKVYSFDIKFYDSGIKQETTINGGELLIENAGQSIWAFNEVKNYVTREN